MVKENKLEKEESGSDKKIDKFALIHLKRMKKKEKKMGPGSSNPKRPNLKGGGISQRGLGKAFMKGGKV